MDQNNRSGMIPFYLVTGFLGSGKTTLLRRILEDYADSQKIGIIQNEFAPANVDGTDLKSSGKPFEILEINKGSVFCVCLLSSFIDSLGAFIDQEAPDLIFLEASGLADPISIGELLDAPELNQKIYLAHTMCIVDALKFLEMEPRMTRITHQVRIADTVVINKTDMGGDIEAIQRRIKELNPYAEVVNATYCDIAFRRILQEQPADPVAVKQSRDLSALEPGGRPDIRSVVIRTSRPVAREQLDRFLEKYIPKTYRMKGYVKLSDGSALTLQTSFEQYSSETLPNYNGNTEIIAMGDNISPREMRNMFIP
jgi:G3E family GTPase